MISQLIGTMNPTGAYVWHLNKLSMSTCAERSLSKLNGLYIAQYPLPKSLMFRVLCCLRLSISSNFMGLVWHVRILILQIFYANVHKILQISYFLLEKLAFGDIFSHYSIFGFSGTAVVNILFCRLACSDILKWDGRTIDPCVFSSVF